MIEIEGGWAGARAARLYKLSSLIGEIAEGPAGEQRGRSIDTERDLLIYSKQKQSVAPKDSRDRVSSPGSCGEAILSLAATAVPVPGGGKKPGYYSENRYLTKLSGQERRRIQQEINKRFKPGEVGRL